VDASGILVRTRSYDSTPADLLAVEGQIAEKVVTSLKGSLPDADPVSLALGGTARPDAFDAYLTGMVLSNSFYAPAASPRRADSRESPTCAMMSVSNFVGIGESMGVPPHAP